MDPNTETNKHQKQTPARGSAPLVPQRHHLDERTGAANVARHQAQHIYEQNPPNQLTKEEPVPIATQPESEPETVTQEAAEDTNPYMQTHEPTFDWQTYHTAWQQYYQQYYHRYYSQQLEDAKATLPEETPKDTDHQPHAVTGSDRLDDAAPKTRFQSLRDDLLATVQDRAKKVGKSQHIIPIACALVVGLLFVFLQYNRALVAKVEEFVSPGSTVSVSDTIIVDPAANTNVGNDPKLIIPKINVNIPVVYSVTTIEESAIQTALENGTVHYNLPGANSTPGQDGNGVILGHSSNDVFDQGSYKFAFVLLDKLQNGDLFYMNYEGKRYVYKVNDKKIIKPSEWRTLQQTTGKPTMILVTCTPVGTAEKRLLVYGEQISPDPTSAATKPANNEDSNPAEIPGNSPTFFERLKDLLF